MSNIPDAMIRVNDVYKSFGDVKALRGMSLQAETGRVLGLLGPNGAGKTTLVRIMTSLLKPDSGMVEVAGIDVTKDPQLVRRNIGLAGQYPAVDEQLTGRENLVMVGQLYHFKRREALRRADELLERFTLTDAANRPVKTYSGGMRRRLDLAASIVAKPRVLLLDEPTTGLDPRTRLDLWNAIRELVKSGATLLLTTQYLDEADALADRIVVIDNGRTVAEGTADELKADLANDVIEMRVEDPQRLKEAAELVDPISKDHPSINEQTNQIKLPVYNGSKSLADAVRVLDQNGIEIADIALRRPSLDDVFMALTGGDGDDDERAAATKPDAA
jgi:ABC-2 type transport system ATP-binding protein